MKFEFYKYQGTGNDFILFDDRSGVTLLSAKDISKLCDRRFGIGADGVILLRSKSGYDFEMVYYNADGNLSSMCGNGGRCIVSFAKSLSLIKSNATFWAADGKHLAEFISTNPDVVKLKMKDVETIQRTEDGWLLDTGSPHLIVQVKDLKSVDVKESGSTIRNSPQFKVAGVNVNFVESSEKGLSVRTYERGVEDETLSCGTGVTATALVALENAWVSKDDSNTLVFTPGGVLKVHALRTELGYSEIWLEGPVSFVFRGEVEI